MRNVRQVTTSVNPKGQALWALEGLYLFLREWAYEVYDTTEHPALGQSPRDAFARGIATAGERAHRMISYDHEFRIFTLPTTPRTTAKVIPGRGVKINNIYYWSELFRQPGLEETKVKVRYDPFNVGLAFAYVRGSWTECHSQYYSIFRHCSERELMIASAELRRRNARHSQRFNLTAVQLAKFLESVESEEILLKQRLADRETNHVLRLINNKTSDVKTGLDNHPKPTSPESASGTPEIHQSSNAEDRAPVDLKAYEEF